MLYSPRGDHRSACAVPSCASFRARLERRGSNSRCHEPRSRTASTYSSRLDTRHRCCSRHPIVVLVHDISFAAHPEWFRWKEGLRRRLLTRWSCDRARLVLTVSDAARREIISHFGVPENRVRRIYPGVVSLHGGSQAHGGSRKQDPPYVDGWSKAQDPPSWCFSSARCSTAATFPISFARSSRLREVIPARTSKSSATIARTRTRICPAIAAAEGIASRVSIRPYVPDAELAELYGRARAFALLSEYEGFGHPPLEASRSRRAVGAARHRRRARSLRRRGDLRGKGRHCRHDRRTEEPAVRRGRPRSVCCARPRLCSRDTHGRVRPRKHLRRSRRRRERRLRLSS